MYRQRKNFGSLDIKIINKKKEVTEIFSSIKEALSVEDLNRLYKNVKNLNNIPSSTNTNNLQTQQITNNQQVSVLPADTLQNVASLDGIDIQKDTTDNSTTMTVKKPLKVKFSGIAENPQGLPVIKKDALGEEVEPIQDEVLASFEELPGNDKKTQEYDILLAAPPLDLSNDEYLNTVKQHSQGMMPVVIKQELPLNNVSIIPNKDNIMSFEEDPDGLSVVGLNNEIGIRFLEKNK